MAKVLMNLADVEVSLAGRPILQGASLELQSDQRVGLVGANGAGKSTLLRLMDGQLSADAGEIFRASGLTWGRLEQEPLLSPDKTVWQEAITAIPEVAALEERMNEIEARMGTPAVYQDADLLAKTIDQHARMLATHQRLDGPRYQSRVKEALSRLGLAETVWQQPSASLSGGQKKLVLLAKLLVRRPQLLLLDEPDNHLDIPAKRHLEQAINSYPGCVVIISHDRYLLDEVATHIADLEQGRITRYVGNYTAYTTERELRRLRQQQMYVAQQKEIARIEAAIARFELWASMVVDVRHIRQARSRRKMLDKMDKVEKVAEQRRMQLEMAGWRGSKKAVEFRRLSLTLPNGRALWKQLNYTLWHGDRVGLVGPNGAGKSMLLRQIEQVAVSYDGGLFEHPTNTAQAATTISAMAGEIRIGPSIKVGYYAQEQETLIGDQSPLEALRNTIPVSEGAAVAHLNRFLFSYDQIRGAISELSGGERSRLQLALLVVQKPNLLLLDEPTNNLDIASIEVLEQTLEEFVGTILIVSHDRYFLDQTVDKIVELRNGRLQEFAGGYTDFLAEQDMV